MDRISKFGERLSEFMHDYELTVEDLRKIIGISKNRIYEWLSGKSKYTPAVPNLIKLADYFKCSLEFLLNVEQENYLTDPKQCPPFSAWFRRAIEAKGYTFYSLGKKTNMTTGNFYKWINGQREPSLDSLLRIAAVIGCSLDYLVGRE